MFTPNSSSTFFEFGLITLVSVFLLWTRRGYAGRARRGWWLLGLFLPWLGVGIHALWHLFTDLGYPIPEMLHYAGEPFFLAGVAILVHNFSALKKSDFTKTE